MSIVKVYQRKREGGVFGSSMKIKEPNIKNVYAPETPVKIPPQPARPQQVYARRSSEHYSENFLARIAAEEARDPICAIITAATSTTENEDSNNSSTPADDCKYLHTDAGFQQDLNESIHDWDENAAAVHGSQNIGDSVDGLFEEGFQKHDLLSIPELEESGNNREQSFMLPYSKKQDAEHGLVSHVNYEKLDHIDCSKPLEPVVISTPLPKKSGSKRPNNGMNNNQRPAKKPKRKKHRAKVAVEVKPKRTPKKMPKLTNPNNIQEKTKKTKGFKKVAIPKFIQEKREKRKYVKKALAFTNNQESSVKEDHKEVAEIPKTENLPVDDNKTAMVSNVNHDLKDDKRLAVESTIQPGMDNKCGAMVLLNGYNLGFDSNQNELRWNVRAMRSAGVYWRKPGCQYNSLRAYKMIFKVDSCLSNSRRVGPNVPRRCMKKRIKRRRKLNMFSTLWSSDYFSGHIRKKRSDVFTQRVDFTSLIVGFREKEEVLVTAPRHLLAIPEEQEFQTTDEVKGENLESLTEGCNEVGLSLEHALTSEANGVQIFCEAKEQSFSLTVPYAAKSKFPEGKSEQRASKKKNQITDESIKAGLKFLEKESGVLLKTVDRSVMNKLGNRQQTLSINDNDRRGPGRPKSKPEQMVDVTKCRKGSDVHALVPYRGRGRAKHEVDLDPDSLRMWNMLMNIVSAVEEEKEERESEQRRLRELLYFRGRIDLLISILHPIQGDRRFTPWNGSVVDSVVGVFLTQNVADFLSSAAFMSLVAKFPVRSTSNEQESTTTDGQRSIESSSTFDSAGRQYFVTEPEPDINHALKCLSAEKAICLLQEDVQRQNDIMRSEPVLDMNHVPRSLTVEKRTCSPGEVVQRQSGKAGNDETEINNRSQNGKTASKETKKTTPRGKNKNVKDMVLRKRDWESLRKIYTRPRSKEQMDSVDWEAVRQAETSELASIIAGRGQQTIIAGRIKEFLNRVVEMHKSIDLEWLRYAPPDDVKEYLLEFTGLGLKSVECVRLLSLQHVAFPVDINVARIAVRLGWVPLKPLPGSLQFHLIEEFPILDNVQKYLWPRLCVLDHRKLYELHYHMITFGKVFCAKRNPKCHACPMKAECKHYASAQASAANLSLPGPSKKSEDKSIVTSKPSETSRSFGNNCVDRNPISVTLLDGNKTIQSGPNDHTCKPIVEEPKSPPQEQDIEDFPWYECTDDEDEEIPTIKLNHEGSNPDGLKTPYSNYMSQALVYVGTTPLPAPKMKFVTSLRTEHQVYELPDNHELLVCLDKREKDDPVPYLLAIWQPGEIPNSSQPPVKLCNSQGSQLCDQRSCFACEGIREQQAGIVRGTILIPCRTAMKGSFPLNGTYFQVNEVFADHKSSHDPIIVRRELLWNLPKRTLYFGSSTASIFRGLPLYEIHKNFWTGFICVKAVERETGAPKPLVERFHCSPSKMEKKGRKRGAETNDAKAIILMHT